MIKDKKKKAIMSIETNKEITNKEKGMIGERARKGSRRSWR